MVFGTLFRGMMHLAEFNRGLLRHDWDDARVADFVNNVDRVNALAMRSPGFVWMLDEEEMHAAQTDPEGPLGGNPRLASTLSVWESPRLLHDFAFKTAHRIFYDRRAEWYAQDQGPRLVMWWVEPDQRPTAGEAAERFNALCRFGQGPEHFGWDWLKRQGGLDAPAA